MKTFGLQGGVNYVDNGYGHIFGIMAGRITNIEVLSDSPGEVEIKVGTNWFDKVKSTVSVSVGNDGYGVSGGLNVLFGIGDTITVTGVRSRAGTSILLGATTNKCLNV